ncbi:amyloid fiber anchoring/assembly protein TapA [Lentibacillus sp. CBA3610]|uniref:amyloid fiber anchoring/assembly protein TapA n=1 Tax=Lentibacillus sp. CBA3610 TaxID=2518176 RepID=UPI0020D2125C|nr:amyloid fiber anchoring/assembly protein TapA [Lentibacillus sp. CBA3610]
MSRLRKFKNRKKLIVTSKLLISCYILIFTFGYMTSGTGAYFNSSSNDKQVIQAGTWWDGSELVFPGPDIQNVEACPPEEIKVDVKNEGFSMINATEYVIYYAENGNPKNNGEKIADGTIEPIEKGETVSLTFEAEQTGSYIFKASQHPDYSGNHQNPWSEKVVVTCIDDNQTNEQEIEKQQSKSNEAQQEQDETSGDAEEKSENTEDKNEQNEKAGNKGNQEEDSDNQEEGTDDTNKQEGIEKSNSKENNKGNADNRKTNDKTDEVNGAAKKKDSREDEADDENQ